MLRKIQLFALTILTLFAITLAHASTPLYTKVIIFGDSLSDIGNNHFNGQGKAPDVEYIDGHAGYLWVHALMDDLVQDGLLAKNHTQIIASDVLAPNPEAFTGVNVDFAYSGDPSGPIEDLASGWHKYNAKNSKCLAGQDGNFSNLCGVYNRVEAYTKNIMPLVDPTPNKTLYIVWSGGNDIQQQLPAEIWHQITGKKALSGAVGDDILSRAARTITDRIMRNTEESVEMLAAHGARHFMILNFPNMAFTPLGYKLNTAYNVVFCHPKTSSQCNRITNDLETVIGYFDQRMFVLTNNIKAKYPKSDFVLPDINKVFEYMQQGDFKSKITGQSLFPAAYNIKPIKGWVTSCCITFDQGANYKFCRHSKKCSGDNPIGPLGHYAFFNSIHPTTCADNYIAKFATSYLPGQKPFDPNKVGDLCD